MGGLFLAVVLVMLGFGIAMRVAGRRRRRDGFVHEPGWDGTGSFHGDNFHTGGGVWIEQSGADSGWSGSDSGSSSSD